MYVIRCKSCESPLLSTNRICPRCGKVCKHNQNMIWFCGITWGVAALAFVAHLIH